MVVYTKRAPEKFPRANRLKGTRLNPSVAKDGGPSEILVATTHRWLTPKEK